MPEKKLKSRIALITGASDGIGKSVAIKFSLEGAHTILLSKNKKKLIETEEIITKHNGTCTLVHLNLKELDKIDQLGYTIFKKWKKLDIFVSCAGILGNLSPIDHIMPKLWDDVMTINFTANYRLIRSLNTLLKQSDSGRAIFVTSNSVKYKEAYWSCYAASKAALNNLVLAYAKECEKTKVKVNLISPGEINTKLRRKAYPGIDPKNWKEPNEITDSFLKLAEPNCKHNGEIINL